MGPPRPFLNLRMQLAVHVWGEEGAGWQWVRPEDGTKTINQVPFLQDFHWPQKTEGAEIPRRALFWFPAGNVH